MNRRRDAFLAAARMSPEIYRIAERSGGGVCTIGSCTTKPGIVTSVVEECRITSTSDISMQKRSRECLRKRKARVKNSQRKETSR